MREIGPKKDLFGVLGCKREVDLLRKTLVIIVFLNKALAVC